MAKNTHDEQMRQLGALICARNPYGKMTLPDGWEQRIEWEYHQVRWTFRETPHRVNKSLRIPVLIEVENEHTKETETYLDWILVGYEGANGT